MAKKLKFLAVCFAALLIAEQTALAVLLPPDWRGTEGSTFQQWEFSTDNLTPPPDAVDNPYGTPLLRVDPIDWWVPDLGAWPLSGQIDVYIPNRPLPLELKEIWLQLTWQPGNKDNSPFIPDEPWVAVTPFEEMKMYRHDTANLEGWTHTWFEIYLWPNPFEEWITIKGDILVDQLTIDTICIPEPATLALLGIGGLMTLIRKKRSA